MAKTKATKTTKKKTTTTKAKAKAKPKPKPVELPVIDLASFPDDLQAHATELEPLVTALRKQAAKRPKQMKIGAPTTRDRVAALAKHYSASLLPDYAALMMLADGIKVTDSYVLFPIDDLMSPKVTKRSEKLRGGYSDCLPVGLFSLSGGWLFVMASWGEPYCEKVMGMKIQQKTIKPWLESMLKDAKKLPHF